MTPDPDATAASSLARVEAYLLDSGAFVSAMAAALTASTAQLFEIPAEGLVIGLAASSTAAVYGLDRLLDQAPADTQNVPQRAAWVSNHAQLLMAQVGVCAIASCVLAALLPLRAQLILVGLGACTTIYGLRLVPGLRGWATPLKPLAIGALWAGGSVLVPFAAADIPLSSGAWFVFATRCLHVITGCLLFDLRDVVGDLASGERSWVSRWGHRGTLAACWLLVVSAALLQLWSVGWRALDLATSLAFCLLLLWPHVEARRFCAVGVDGALGLPGLVALAALLVA